MLIRFWFGALFIGRPSGLGEVGEYDALITWCWGRRGYDIPPGELRWRFIWRFAWDWFPVAMFQTEREPLSTSEYASSRLISKIAGGQPKKSEVSSCWTGREKFVGWTDWRSSVSVLRSTRRSKMYVYLTGAKERASSHHVVYIAPAAYPGVAEAPAEWYGSDKAAKTFEIKFIHGRAEVEQNLGEFMIEHGLAQRTRLVRAAGGMLGSLAKAISGR